MQAFLRQREARIQKSVGLCWMFCMASVRALSKSFIMKGSQGLGVRKHEGESQEPYMAGVRKHKGGSREPWKPALIRSCKTGCKFT